MSTVAVIGTGYVGLTTGAYLAHLGHHVVCADSDAAKVARLNDGEIPIHEAGLPELVAEGRASGRLSFVVGNPAAVDDAEFVILCLPTPPGSDGSADLAALESVATEIGPLLRSEAIVVTKSTVPVGTVMRVASHLGRNDVAVVSSPEFMREGSAVQDCLNPERIVIGTDDHATAMRVAELFEHLNAPLIVTDPASAELVKYASNAFLATKVSFVNALAHLCELLGADSRDVLLAMGYDKRIGFEWLRPGPGWGGSCLPKDLRALIRSAEDVGDDAAILRAVADVNDRQFDRVVGKIERLAEGDLAGTAVAVWGLTFKANTNDLRESPALAIVERLAARGARVKGFDPMVSSPLTNLEVCPDAYAACEDAVVLAVLTEWDEFRWLDFDKVRTAMASPAIVDARNLLDPAALRRKGFVYEGIGRA